MQYRNTSCAEGSYDTYWFEKNLQGDIVAVYSETGTKLIAYTYDAWGNFSTTYYNGSASTTATYNPFRYRGYYYDVELGFYGSRGRILYFGKCCWKVSKKIGGKFKLSQLSKQSPATIKKVVNSIFNVPSSERNAVKNLTWTLSQEAYKSLPSKLMGKNIPQLANSLTVGITGYGTMYLLDKFGVFE